MKPHAYNPWLEKLRPTSIVMLLALPGICFGQSGLSVDLLELAYSKNDLLTIHSPNLSPGQLEAVVGADWGYHLLGLKPSEHLEVTWIVKHRLSMRAAASYTPNRALRLTAGFTGVVVQEGLRIDAVGARVPIQNGMGSSWLTAVWAWPLDAPVQAALATTVLLPSASAECLCGETRPNLRMTLLLSSRWWLLRPTVNLGVTTRARTRFYSLVREEGLIYRLGVAFGKPDWPLNGSIELAGETRLLRPFSSLDHEFLEGLVSLKIRVVQGFELQLGAGRGLFGLGTPTVRGLVLVRWFDQLRKKNEKHK